MTRAIARSTALACGMALCASLAVACAAPGGDLDAGALDAAVLEAAVLDAAILDAAILDARTPDAEPLDARVLDARAPASDAELGSRDGGAEARPCLPAERDPGRRVALQWARLDCEADACTLSGRVDVANLAPEKEVTVVYRAGGAWREVAASWHSMIDPSRERWYFEAPALEPVAGAELFVEHASSVGTFADGSAERPHCLRGGVLLVEAPLALVEASVSEGRLRGTILAPGASSARVVLTTDGWATQRTVEATPEDALHRFTADVPLDAREIELAAAADIDGEARWDNFFGDDHALRPALSALRGAWDLHAGAEPSWLEVRDRIGLAPLRFVGAIGSVRPVFAVELTESGFRADVPPQHEPSAIELTLERDGETLAGTRVASGVSRAVRGERAPALIRTAAGFGPPASLFDGATLEGWRASGGGPSRWRAEAGALINEAAGANLVSDERYDDFRLELEVRLPPGGNSGVYLRGRYEVQLLDDAGARPSAWRSGGVYGWLAPSTSPAGGEWRHLEVTLVGRVVTVRIDGTTVIDARPIPGITGGALDANEREPGPLVLQGDHSAVSFRNLRIARAL